MRRTSVLRAAAIAAVLLALPATAAGSVRLAVPAGGASTGACDAAAPCTLAAAIAGALSGDRVSVAAGTYAVATPLNVTVAGLAIEGDQTAAPPLLQWTGSPNAGFVRLAADGQTLGGLRVEGGTNGAFSLVATSPSTTGATLERVQVRNVGSGSAVALKGSLLRDSTVVSTGAGGIAAVMTGTLTSSTLVADGFGGDALYTSTGYAAGPAAVTVRNTILRGEASGWDGLADDNDGAGGTSAAIDVGHSAYGAGRLLTAGESAAVTDGAGNVTGVGPLLAGLPGGLDLHQLRGSPTIDTGTAGGLALGALDVDGDPRVFGTATDIGADEYMPPPLVAIQTVVVSDTSAAVSVLVTPRGSDTTWHLEYGTTTAYGSTLAGGSIAKAADPATGQSVGATISGLKGATSYHVRIVGTSAKGTTTGPDVSFRTTSSPAPPVAGRAKITRARLSKRSVRRGKQVALRLRSSAAGDLEVVLSRLQPGRRKGRACVAARRRCTAVVRLSALTRKVLPGDNGPIQVVTNGMKRGHYQLSLSVVGLDGKRSATVKLILRVR